MFLVSKRRKKLHHAQTTPTTFLDKAGNLYLLLHVLQSVEKLPYTFVQVSKIPWPCIFSFFFCHEDSPNDGPIKYIFLTPGH